MNLPRGPVRQPSPQRLPPRYAFVLLSFLLPYLTACNAPPNQPPVSTPSVSRHEDRERGRDREAHNGPYSKSDSQNGDFGQDGGYSRDDSNHRPHRRRHAEPEEDGGSYSFRANTTPGTFDFYLLNLSWAPEYCHGHPQAAECQNHSTFVLHGLWPQNNDGSYPAHCSDAPGPVNPAQFNGLYPSAGLMQHEWQTHGTCTGLTPEAYLATAQRAVAEVSIPAALAHLSTSTDLPPSQILQMFTQSNPGLPAASLALSCGNNYLTAVEVCMDRNLHPTACQRVRSCGATTVRIPAP